MARDRQRPDTQVARLLRPDEASPRPRRIAIGNFDGVHLGHRDVIGSADTVVTFDPHPLRVVGGGRGPRVLTGLARRAELVGHLGVAEVVVIPFDAEFAARSASWFIDELLVGRLGATHVSVGEDFRFGHGAAGDPGLLRADGRFGVTVVPMRTREDAVISSSRIRALLAAGDAERAAGLLGIPFLLDELRLEAQRQQGGSWKARFEPPADRQLPASGFYECGVRIGRRPPIAGVAEVKRRSPDGCEIVEVALAERVAAEAEVRVSVLRRTELRVESRSAYSLDPHGGIQQQLLGSCC